MNDEGKYPCPHHEGLVITMNTVCGKIDQLRKDAKWILMGGVIILIALFGYTNLRINRVEEGVQHLQVDMATVKASVMDVPGMRKDHFKLDHRVTVVEEKIEDLENHKK